MEKCRILSSKRLTKSFTKVDDLNIWESIVFDTSEAQTIIAAALRKLTDKSEPLTITITPVEH
jgi:hypothetical protein